ncbi:MAG: GNAT family N-acetyltransferase [Haloarculaceae archaeon]
MSLSIERVTDRDGVLAGIGLWNEHVPAFAVPNWLAEQSLFAPFDGVTVRCYAAREDGRRRAFAVLKRLERAVGDYDPTDRAWLSVLAFDPGTDAGRAAARELLAAIAEDLRADGAAELVFGRDPGNFFAGVPRGVPDAYVDVLDGAGFAFEGVAHDLERSIAGYSPPERVRETDREWPGLDVVPATGREDELLAFLDDQFSGRWRYEAANVCRVPGGPDDYWLLLFDGEVAGFLRSNRHDGAYRGPNVNWGYRLSDEHCGVGPLGVHESYRGRGWGLYMISAVLERLAADGYDRCVIDWTDLVGYYGKLGFEEWVRYAGATLDLTR